MFSPLPSGSVSKLLPSCNRKIKQITNRNGKDKNGVSNCIFFWFRFEDVVGEQLENDMSVKLLDLFETEWIVLDSK